MTGSHFNSLLRFILLSFGLLIGATMVNLGPLLSMAAGVAPMIIYHLGYLYPKAKKGLSHTAIDSVYYFGFLVTVAALGISAMTIASRGASTDINTVVYQFGVGLIATGYAVIARMHLSSVATVEDRESPEAILDHYLKRSREMVDNVELASNRIAELSVVVINRTAEVSEVSRAATEKVLRDMAHVFDQEMKLTLTSARDGLNEVRALASDVSFAAERDALTRSVKATLEAVTLLNKGLAEYASATRAGTDLTQQSITTSAALNRALDTLRTNVELLAGNEGAIVKSAAALSDASAVIVEGSRAVHGVTTELAHAASAVADTGPTFQKMRTMAKKTQEQMDSLVEVTERLGGAVTRIDETAGATGRLSIALDHTAEALPKLVGNVEGLRSQFDQAGQVAHRLANQLNSLPQPIKDLTAASAGIPDALTHIVQAITDAAAHAES